MKYIRFSTVISMLVLVFAGCRDKCSVETIYDANVPVYLSYEELRKPLTLSASQVLEKPSKFWRTENHLFVSDLNKGIHIYNISNPAAPQELVFVNVPGVVDVAVKGNYLLADSYTDLLVIDISNPSSPSEVKRLTDVFEYNPFKVEAKTGYPVVAPDKAKGVVIGWNIEKVKDEQACTPGGNTVFYETGDMVNFGGGSLASGAGGGPATYSGGGSLAAFAVRGDFLYSVSPSSLSAYSLADPSNPSKVSEQQVGMSIETIVAYERFLFIGSQNGVFIYSLQNASTPTFVSQFTHATACDPVVVSEDIAYVTLRDGTPCQNGSNQLDVLNVNQVQNPTLIRTYPMVNPHGLGIEGNILAICEGTHGVKVFNAADPANLLYIQELTGLSVKDVIMYNGVAMFIGDNGIYLYTYNQSGNFQAAGVIAIVG